MKLNRIILVLTVVAFVSTTLGGYLYYLSLKHSIYEKIIYEADHKVKDVARDISLHIGEHQKWLGALSGGEEFQLALTDRNEITLAEANSTLDRLINYQEDISVGYLMDENGNTIASTNRNSTGSFVGKNYSFRPYFQDAISGKPSVYMALGVTSKKRGLYISFPVFGPDKKVPIGVLVTKESVDHIINKIGSEDQVDGIMLLTGPNDIVFLSSRQDWLNRPLWEVIPEVTSEITASRQFGEGPWDWTGLKKTNGNHAIDSSGDKYYIHSEEIYIYPGWHITYLHDHGVISWNIMAPILQGGGYIVFPLFLLVCLSFALLYKMATHEIINRKKADAALQNERDRVQNYLDISGVMIVALDADGTILHINQKGCEVLGGDEDNIVGKNWFNHFLPIRIKDEVFDVFLKLMAGNIEQVEYYENPVLNKIGEERTIAFHNTVLKNRSGEITGILFSGEDITERHKTDKLLLQSKQDWEDTFDTITDMITVHDRDFNIIRANKAAKKILGIPFLNEDSAAKCYKYYHGTDSSPEGCPSCDCLKTMMPSSFEIFEPHLNMHMEIRAIPRFDSNNQFAGLIHVVRDLTEKKKLETQLLQAQKMEAVGQLAGGVAHDFNNVLTAIINYSHLLKDIAVKDSSKEMIDKILALSDKAANITQGLLAFSRKQHVESRPVNLNNVIRDTEKLFRNFIGEHIAFTSKLSVSELIIMADVTHLEQCIMNLVTNGRDAMIGGGRLTVQTEDMEIDTDFINAHGFGMAGSYALMTVSDTGTGMDEETQRQIFDPFYTTKEVGKGTGLGLAIVYGIIKQHKGYINVYSEPGTGTTFKLYFPLIKSNVEVSDEKTPSNITGNAETLLVVEDEQEVRESICKILEKSGYRVIEATDGVDGVEKFREHKDEIRLAILDVIMPKKNGKETYEEINRISPVIKTIFMSGYTAELIHDNDIIGNNMNFISKPIMPTLLLTKIKDVLGDEYAN